jgi:NTP pyrophosphatase (non-canonical NTP hydrolase)
MSASDADAWNIKREYRRNFRERESTFAKTGEGIAALFEEVADAIRQSTIEPPAQPDLVRAQKGCC